MRIIYFHLPHYPKWFDGLNKYQTRVYECFKKTGKDVHSFGKPFNIKKGGSKLIQKIYQLLYIFGIFSAIFHIIKIPRYSIIVMTNASFLHYSFPLFINKLWKKHKYLLVVHDLIQKERPTYLRKKLESYFIRNSDKVICNSNTTKNDLIALNLASDDVEIVYPGIEVCSELIPEVKLFPESIKLLYVGSIEKRKGIIYLIEALSKISTDFSLDIIGIVNFPDYYKILEDRIEELGLEKRISFRGRVSQEELIKYYLNSSIFVFPTLYEGYGMAVAEAMVYGLPIVASKLAPIEEFLENEKEGFLVEPRNPDKFAEALSKLMNDPILMNSFSENSISKSKSFHSWEDQSLKIWHIINKVFTL
jgi:glycosyltransferase involved in cell wall biosynthesis